jgi:hypothetical protein
MQGQIHAITRAWEISFQQIQKEHIEAASLLSLMCYFYRKNIPKYLLENGGDPLATGEDIACDCGGGCRSGLSDCLQEIISVVHDALRPYFCRAISWNKIHTNKPELALDLSALRLNKKRQVSILVN